MKKFFALFTVVALLAVAGSAFATDPTVSFSPSSLTVTVGGSNEATVDATAVNGGEITGFPQLASDAPEWVTLVGWLLTADASGVSAGTYTATVTATETYSTTDSEGHVSEKTATGSATITITVSAPLKEDGNNADGSSYNTDVDDDVVDAISEALGLGATVQKLPDTVKIKANDTDAQSLAKMTFSDSNTRGVVALPVMEDIPAGTYVIEITLPIDMPKVTVIPQLYPNGASSSPVDVKFFSGSTQITDSNVEDYFIGGATINMVFTVDGNGKFVATSVEAAAASMSNPVLAVTPEYSDPSGPGKSSGGCDAGFTALALAVLGGFIATRRK